MKIKIFSGLVGDQFTLSKLEREVNDFYEKHEDKNEDKNIETKWLQTPSNSEAVDSKSTAPLNARLTAVITVSS